MRVKRKACKPIVTPIQQSEDHYCGPACAAMVLRTINIAPAVSNTALQDQVWAKVKSHSTGSSWSSPPSCKDGELPSFAKQQCYVCNSCWRCWASTADALAAALKDFGAAMDVIRDNNIPAQTLLAAAVASLDQSFPAIVGMSSSAHWEVLAGYCVDQNSPADFQSVQIGTRQIGSFFVIDPMFDYQPGQLDAKPALGVLLGIGVVSCGPPSDVGHSLALVKSRSLTTAKIAMTQMTNIPSSSGGPLRDWNTLLAAAREIQQSLMLNPEWDYAFQDAEPQKPLVVQHVGDSDGYFYISDYTKKGGVTGRVAYTFTPERIRILRVHGATVPDTFLPAFVTPLQTIAEREGRAFSDHDSRVVRREMIGIHPVLVWRDCAQSHNEMWPFYVITHGDRRYFQRVDGKIFSELTPSLPGY